MDRHRERLALRGLFTEAVEAMTKLLAMCFIAMLAGFAIPTSAQEKQTLRLVQSIPLPGVKSRLDHIAADPEKKRLFVAAVTNNSLEVVDLAGGKVTKVSPDSATLRTRSSWAVASTNCMCPASMVI